MKKFLINLVLGVGKDDKYIKYINSALGMQRTSKRYYVRILWYKIPVAGKMYSSFQSFIQLAEK